MIASLRSLIRRNVCRCMVIGHDVVTTIPAAEPGWSITVCGRRCCRGRQRAFSRRRTRPRSGTPLGGVHNGPPATSDRTRPPLGGSGTSRRPTA